MKTILVIAATLGMSAPAFAECDYNKVTANAGIDRTTTASVIVDKQATSHATFINKTVRLPPDDAKTE